MSSFFSYESKPMQILMFVGDLIILNVIFLVCCLPIFTIGAAQAGLYTAMKAIFIFAVTIFIFKIKTLRILFFNKII